MPKQVVLAFLLRSMVILALCGLQAPALWAASAVLASADGESPGARVEITELKRAGGGTVLLKFVLINDSDQRLIFGCDFTQSTSDCGSISGAHLIDSTNRKKHFVILDAQGNCLCSRKLSPLKAKSRINLWAQFPEPPGDVQKVNVLIPRFTPMLEVPLSR